MPHITKSFFETAFQKYQSALKRQLVGRSSRLDDIISTLEKCARTIQHDFSIIRRTKDEKTRLPILHQSRRFSLTKRDSSFIAKLNTTYQSTANTSSFRIIEIVEGITSDVLKDPGTLFIRVFDFS